MLKKIAVLGLLCLLCLLCFGGTALAANEEVSFWGIHTSNAPMKGLKAEPSGGTFSYIIIHPWVDSAQEIHLAAGDVMSVDAKAAFSVKGQNSVVTKNFSSAGEQSFDVKKGSVMPTRDDGTVRTYFHPAIPDGKGGNDAVNFTSGAEVALDGSVISACLGGKPLYATLNCIKTADQLTANFVPYVELVSDDKGFIVGAKARMVDPANIGTALALSGVSWWNQGGLDVRFSTDGTAKNFRRVQFVPNNSSAQELEFPLPSGFEGVIRADRIMLTEIGYRYNTSFESSMMWQFQNSDFKPAEELKSADVGSTGTKIELVSVDVSAEGLTIPPAAGITIDKAADGTAVVTAAMTDELKKDTVKLVKAAEFEVSYAIVPDGTQVLPTAMKFSATSAEIGSAVWNMIKGANQDTILKYVRVFKITSPLIGGSKAYDLTSVVPAVDWAKVFSAAVSGDKVDITANIMIMDSGDVSGNPFNGGVKTFGSASYLMYMDGAMDGKFKDPIALVSYANPPSGGGGSTGSSPGSSGSSGSSGCNVGFASLALLFAAPLFFRKKK